MPAPSNRNPATRLEDAWRTTRGALLFIAGLLGFVTFYQVFQPDPPPGHVPPGPPGSFVGLLFPMFFFSGFALVIYVRRGQARMTDVRRGKLRRALVPVDRWLFRLAGLRYHQVCWNAVELAVAGQAGEARRELALVEQHGPVPDGARILTGAFIEYLHGDALAARRAVATLASRPDLAPAVARWVRLVAALGDVFLGTADPRTAAELAPWAQSAEELPALVAAWALAALREYEGNSALAGSLRSIIKGRAPGNATLNSALVYTPATSREPAGPLPETSGARPPSQEENHRYLRSSTVDALTRSFSRAPHRSRLFPLVLALAALSLVLSFHHITVSPYAAGAGGGLVFLGVALWLRRRHRRDYLRALQEPGPEKLVSVIEASMASGVVSDSDAFAAHAKALAYALYGRTDEAKNTLAGIDWTGRAPLVQASGVACAGVIALLCDRDTAKALDLARRAQTLSAVNRLIPGADQSALFYATTVALVEAHAGVASAEGRRTLEQSAADSRYPARQVLALSGLAIALEGDGRRGAEARERLRLLAPHCPALVVTPARPDAA